MFTSIFTKLPIFSLEFVQSLRKRRIKPTNWYFEPYSREILNFDANTEIWSQISRESWIFDKNVKIWSQIPDENTEIWSQMPREIWNPEENTKIFSQIPRESWIFDENTEIWARFHENPGISTKIPRFEPDPTRILEFSRKCRDWSHISRESWNPDIWSQNLYFLRGSAECPCAPYFLNLWLKKNNV